MLLSRKPIGTIAYMGGIPAVLEKFCHAWSQMIQYNYEYLLAPGQSIYYTRSVVSFHAFARNNLALHMRGDWLLMLDTDHEFEPDIAARLLTAMENYEADVITGVYCHKTPPHAPVLYQINEHGAVLPIGDWDRSVKAFQVGSAGAGCLLVKRKVFDRIREELNEDPFDITHPFGEDHSFFKRLEKLQIATYAAVTVESPHLLIKPLTLSDYKSDGLIFAPKKEVAGFK